MMWYGGMNGVTRILWLHWRSLARQFSRTTPHFALYCVRIDYSNVYNLQVILLKDVKVEKRCLPWVTVTEMSIA